MDSKTSFAVLTAQITLFVVLAIVTVDGVGLVFLNKPFFSNNLRETEAVKNIPVIGATEEVTSAIKSKASISNASKNGERTFSCTSQKGDNTTKGTPMTITLHETPTIHTSPALSLSSSLQSPAVASSAVYVAMPTLRTETANLQGDGCPSEYNITHGSSCYKFFDIGSRATRSDAQSACKRDSSHLVFIETKEENDFLVRGAGSNTEYWIGIHERPNLFWDDGNQVTYANIDPYNRYTFNDGTGCYRMYKNDNGWHDAECTRRCHYICEHEGEDCPEEYASNHSASCYKFADSKATLPEARSACMNDSSHLVFIETKEENDFLIREATSGNEYWIGVYERPHLFWDNGNHVTFANIDPDDMDTLSERNGCYRMCNGTKRYWRDSSCNHKHGYICEYED